MLGFIRRTISGNKISSPTLRSLFVTLVRSHLKYASEIWSLNSVTMIKRIEPRSRWPKKGNISTDDKERNQMRYVSEHKLCFVKRAWESNCLHCRFNVRSQSRWVLNKNALLAFHSVWLVHFRDKIRSLGNKMLWKAITRHKLRNDD